ncbi:hypothetical protein EVAR_51315_1 [Eumeta japonica]|uniref:Uncharacterized protein n=1 Tax=Eumeta variegata TaxID=151549 RepID=A0A4C1ZZ65_EUMVA|nr:hypothetical protein EVAR_51315_1 [Eumeta japonica]
MLWSSWLIQYHSLPEHGRKATISAAVLRPVCENSGGPLPFHHPKTSLHQPLPLFTIPLSFPQAHSYHHQLSYSCLKGRQRIDDSGGVVRDFTWNLVTKLIS